MTAPASAVAHWISVSLARSSPRRWTSSASAAAATFGLGHKHLDSTQQLHARERLRAARGYQAAALGRLSGERILHR